MRFLPPTSFVFLLSSLALAPQIAQADVKSKVHTVQDSITLQAEDTSHQEELSIINDGVGARIGIVRSLQNNCKSDSSRLVCQEYVTWVLLPRTMDHETTG